MDSAVYCNGASVIVTFLKSLRLFFLLLTAIAGLIVIPALQLGIIGDWKVIFLSISYVFFFFGTVWRIVRYGQLANRREDRQVQDTSGRLVSLTSVVGLVGFHWLTLYTFSVQNQNMSPTVEQCLTGISISLIVAAILLCQTAITTLGKYFDRLIIKADHQNLFEKL